MAADLSHLEGQGAVNGYVMEVGKDAKDYLRECLTGCSLVLIPAGMPRKPGQDRKDLLKVNAGIAQQNVEAVAKHCPDAVVALIVNPVMGTQQARILSDAEQHAYFQRCEVRWCVARRTLLYRVRFLSWH